MSTFPTAINVLHVDDEADFADVAATFLEREDDRFQLRTAASATEGLEMLSDFQADCVVSDYDMPGQSGLEFLESVRESYPDLPFILYTGKGSEEVASEAISAGVTDYLQKESGTDQYAVLANRIVNVVEHYRSQQALATRNREFRSYERMVNSMHEAACIYGPEGRFEVVNEYLADWYGTSQDTLKGQQSNLIPKIRAETDGDPIQELFDGERRELFGQLSSEFPGHGHAVLEYRLTPLEVDGAIEGVVGVVRDVTERTERERKLRAIQRRTRELMESKTATETAEIGVEIATKVLEAPLSGVHLLDDEGAVLEPAAFVDTVRDTLGDPPSYRHGPDPDPASNVVWDAFESGSVRYIDDVTTEPELPSVTPARSGIIHPLDDHGVFIVSATEAHAFDTTEKALLEILASSLTVSLDRAHREELLREREQRLENKNERLEEFTSIVSHDLQGPLTVADGRLELARKDCGSEHLDSVSRALERMDALLENLLTLAREGATATDVVELDFETVLERSWQTIETKQADLVVDLDREIVADESRLCQLVENLVSNAVEHGGESVTITIGEMVDGFYVEDDGEGLGEADRAAVFDAGYSTTEGGTGFGLNIVQRVCEAHSWEIQVLEGSRGGARFEVTGVDFVDK